MKKLKLSMPFEQWYTKELKKDRSFIKELCGNVVDDLDELFQWMSLTSLLPSLPKQYFYIKNTDEYYLSNVIRLEIKCVIKNYSYSVGYVNIHDNGEIYTSGFDNKKYENVNQVSDILVELYYQMLSYYENMVA